MEENGLKARILRGAEELFMRYGIRSVSMDDIARQLGISKKTLYQHVTEKEELVLEVAHLNFERNKTLVECACNEARNPVEKLAMLSMCIRSTLESVNPSVLFDLQKFHPQAWNAWLDFKRGYLRESIISLLKEGIEQGYVRKEIDPEVMASMRIEMVQIAFNSELFPGNYTFGQIQEQLYDHFVYGLVTDKGRKLYQKYKSRINQQPVNHL